MLIIFAKKTEANRGLSNGDAGQRRERYELTTFSSKGHNFIRLTTDVSWANRTGVNEWDIIKPITASRKGFWGSQRW